MTTSALTKRDCRPSIPSQSTQRAGRAVACEALRGILTKAWWLRTLLEAGLLAKFSMPGVFVVSERLCPVRIWKGESEGEV